MFENFEDGILILKSFKSVFITLVFKINLSLNFKKNIISMHLKAFKTKSVKKSSKNSKSKGNRKSSEKAQVHFDSKIKFF